jgi:hypothetical protein
VLESKFKLNDYLLLHPNYGSLYFAVLRVFFAILRGKMIFKRKGPLRFNKGNGLKGLLFVFRSINIVNRRFRASQG